MDWQTRIDINWPKPSLDYSRRFWFTGSCFAEQMSDRMKRLLFNVTDCPFGILFNPLSIAGAFSRIEQCREFTADEVIESEGMYVSYLHHGRMAKASVQEFLESANKDLKKASEEWKKADVVVVSLGTAWIYRLKKTGEVVANCHKAAAADFERSRMEPEQVADAFSALIEANRQKEWIFTVSPVRHWKDGAHGNALSKGALLMGVDILQRRFPDLKYFPSYELMMDELRDYRFYAADRLHPSDEAADYIWSRFLDSAFTPETGALCKKIETVRQSMEHRPLHGETQAYKDFCKNQYQKVLQLKKDYPLLAWGEVVDFWQRFVV